jgi:hypothetical protein
MRDAPQHVAIRSEDDRIVRLAEPRGPLGDRVQNRLDVRPRARDDPQDLGRRGLLVERLGDLGMGGGQRAFLLL